MLNMADWKSRYESFKRRNDNKDQRSMEVVSAVADTALTFAGVGLMGYLHGRKGGIPAVAGMPLDAAGGAAFGLGGLALVMSGWGWGRHIAAFGTGLGSYWFGSYMADFGSRRREKAGEKLGRQLTTEEAQKAGVVARPPVLAGQGVFAHYGQEARV